MDKQESALRCITAIERDTWWALTLWNTLNKNEMLWWIFYPNDIAAAFSILGSQYFWKTQIFERRTFNSYKAIDHIQDIFPTSYPNSPT